MKTKKKRQTPDAKKQKNRYKGGWTRIINHVSAAGVAPRIDHRPLAKSVVGVARRGQRETSAIHEHRTRRQQLWEHGADEFVSSPSSKSSSSKSSSSSSRRGGVLETVRRQTLDERDADAEDGAVRTHGVVRGELRSTGQI